MDANDVEQYEAEAHNYDETEYILPSFSSNIHQASIDETLEYYEVFKKVSLFSQLPKKIADPSYTLKSLSHCQSLLVESILPKHAPLDRVLDLKQPFIESKHFQTINKNSFQLQKHSPEFFDIDFAEISLAWMKKYFFLIDSKSYFARSSSQKINLAIKYRMIAVGYLRFIVRKQFHMQLKTYWPEDQSNNCYSKRSQGDLFDLLLIQRRKYFYTMLEVCSPLLKKIDQLLKIDMYTFLKNVLCEDEILPASVVREQLLGKYISLEGYQSYNQDMVSYKVMHSFYRERFLRREFQSRYLIVESYLQTNPIEQEVFSSTRSFQAFHSPVQRCLILDFPSENIISCHSIIKYINKQVKSFTRIFQNQKNSIYLHQYGRFALINRSTQPS